MEQQQIAVEINDVKAIPFCEVKRLIEFLEYASAVRVMVSIAALTGCRMSELDCMTRNSIVASDRVYLVWRPGKGQKGQRKEALPRWFLPELDLYLKTHALIAKGGSEAPLFNFNHHSLRRYINQFVRPKVGGAWLTKTMNTRGSMNGSEYLYQLKHLRHNFATLDFARNIERWGKDVAIEFTAKRLRHSSYKMTVGYYIESFEALRIHKYRAFSMADILRGAGQMKLFEFI